MPQYLISHTYLTLDDDNSRPIVETETATADDIYAVTEIVTAVLDAPGGRSGTTIALTVTPVPENTITI